MDVTPGNTPADAEVNNDTLSMIADLRASAEPQEAEPSTPAPAPAPSPEAPPAPAPAPEAAPETTESESPEDAERQAEERRNAMLREIAVNPALSQQYSYQQQQRPAYQPQPAAPTQATEPELPFDEFSFDPTNEQHMAALIEHKLNQAAQPLVDKVDSIANRFQREEEQAQEQHFQQMVQHANQQTVEFLDTYVPGMAGMIEKYTKGEALSATEKAVINEAINAESILFAQLDQQGYDPVATRLDPRVRLTIAQQIGPQLKTYAKELGLVAQPRQATSTPSITPEAKAAIDRESYVESSNAVPAASAGSFEKAYEKGDSLSMIRALRAT